MLENEIIPLYFNKNYKGYSPEWIQYIKRSIGKIAPIFTMKRQLDDYISRFYQPEAKRYAKLAKSDYKVAREIVAWKENVASRWNDVQILSCEFHDESNNNGVCSTGDRINAKAVLNTAGLGDAIGVELVVYEDKDGESKYLRREDLKVVKKDGDVLTYEFNGVIREAGVYRFSFRMYPKNDLLPHRQDFAYTRWF